VLSCMHMPSVSSWERLPRSPHEYREDVWHRRKPCRGAAKISCALSLSEKRVRAGLASLEL
jgi:hypothetical protein